MKTNDFVNLFGASQEDLDRIKAFGKVALPHLDAVVDQLYEYLKDVLKDDFKVHFPDDRALTRAKGLSRNAWVQFLSSDWDETYIQSRIRIGEVHAQLQIEPRHYLAAMSKVLEFMTAAALPALPADQHMPTIAALYRIAQMESALVVDTYAARTSDIITKQSRALTDMSTPITAIWDGILMLPVVGIVDSRRAQDIMQRMLEQISEKRATVFILDISGVAVVDTAVANHLIRMTKAARLMGSYTIVSGLSPSVAQTIVELGIEVGEMRTTGNLQDALRIAFDRIGGVNPGASASK